MNKSRFSIVILALAFMCAACSPDPAPEYQPVTQTPQLQMQPLVGVGPIVQAAPQHSGMQDMVTGAAIGALATHALTSNSRQAAPAAAPVVHNVTVVQKTTVVNKPAAPPPRAVEPVRVAAAPAPAPRATPSYSPPAAAPSSYRVTYSPMPSRR